MLTSYHKCFIHKRLTDVRELLTQRTEVRFVEEVRSLGIRKDQVVLVTVHHVLQSGDTEV
jgi:hypothetical protein